MVAFNRERCVLMNIDLPHKCGPNCGRMEEDKLDLAENAARCEGCVRFRLGSYVAVIAAALLFVATYLARG